MELKSGQIWALYAENRISENIVKVLTVEKVSNNGTFTGGFYTIGSPSDFVWREEVPEWEILGEEAWKLVSALNVVDILENLVHLRRRYSEILGRTGQEEKEKEHAECSAIIYLFNSKDECAGRLIAENIHCTPLFHEKERTR